MAEANYQESDGRMTGQIKNNSKLMQIQMHINE